MVNRTSISVLVVDDYEQWRKVVRTSLRTNFGLRTIEEAADGLDALQKATDRLPDLVILDIGLPKLNGIEVARQIRSVSPASRVVFLTENHTDDFAEAAFGSGAKAYITKSAFAKEFRPAVEAVLEGRELRSAGVATFRMEPQTA